MRAMVSTHGFVYDGFNLNGFGPYFCECSKFDRDGILCCHIMKVLTRIGVKAIPERYILKRWMPAAVGQDEDTNRNDSVQNDAAVHVQPDLVARGMPLKGKKTLWFTNLSTSFADLAAEGAVSNETYQIMDKHIKMMYAELNEVKQKKKNSRRSGKSGMAQPSTSANANAPNVGAAIAEPTATNLLDPPVMVATMPVDVGTPAPTKITTGCVAGSSSVSVLPSINNPPVSKTKGRKREKRFTKGGLPLGCPEKEEQVQQMPFDGT